MLKDEECEGLVRVLTQLCWWWAWHSCNTYYVLLFCGGDVPEAWGLKTALQYKLLIAGQACATTMTPCCCCCIWQYCR
jgi:hypothetical protein